MALLPSIPAVLVRLNQSMRNPRVGLDELAGVLLHDPGLSARVVAAATLQAAPRHPDAGSLQALLAGLGPDTLRTLATEALVQRFFSPFAEDAGAGFGQLWLASLRCACMCRSLARLAEYAAPEEAYLVGLLHNLDQWLSVATDAAATGGRVEGVSDGGHEGIAATLLERWNPDSFASDALVLRQVPLGQVADSPLLVRLVNVSCTLANGGLDDQEQEDFLDRASHVLGLSQRGILELWQLAQRDVRDVLINYGFEGDEPAPRVDDERARIDLGRHVRDAALTGMLIQVTDKSAWQAVLDNFSLLFEPASVAVFEYDEDSRSLRGRESRGVRGMQAIRRLQLPLERGRTLPAEACLEETLLFSTDADLPDMASGVDRQLRRLMGAPQLMALPLIGHEGRPLGVLVGGLDEVQAHHLRQQADLLEQYRDIAVQQLERDVFGLEERVAALEEQLHGLQSHTSKLVHEANNPLGVIKNYLQVLASRLQGDQEKHGQLEVIDQEIDRVTDILGRLRDIGNEPEPSGNTVDINTLVEDLASVFEGSLFATRQIGIELSLDERLPPILGNRNHLKQVLTNLLKNAAEALSSGDRVHIETRDSVILDGRKHVQILIADNGPGLPDDILEHIFTPVVSQKGGSHSGLGLVIVKNLLSEMNGSIVVFSTPESGTRFEILLPRELPDE